MSAYKRPLLVLSACRAYVVEKYGLASIPVEVGTTVWCLFKRKVINILVASFIYNYHLHIIYR